jgi:predicted nucleic acid-binding protein
LRWSWRLQWGSSSASWHAAIYKASGGLPYADAFAAALARLRKAELVTGDPDFKRIEQEIKIFWLS